MYEQEKEQDETVSRKRYTKPQITRVELRADEAVLGSCKNAGSAGPGQSPCNAIAICSSFAS